MVGMKLHGDISSARAVRTIFPYGTSARTEPLSFSTRMAALFPHPDHSRPLHSVRPPDKYKSGRSSAKMGGKMATTVATIVIIFTVCVDLDK